MPDDDSHPTKLWRSPPSAALVAAIEGRLTAEMRQLAAKLRGSEEYRGTLAVSGRAPTLANFWHDLRHGIGRHLILVDVEWRALWMALEDILKTLEVDQENVALEAERPSAGKAAPKRRSERKVVKDSTIDAWYRENAPRQKKGA